MHDIKLTLAVSDRAPMVRPWKEAEKDTISEGAVASASYGSTPAATHEQAQFQRHYLFAF